MLDCVKVEENINVDIMRDSRESSNVAFMDFVENYQYFDSHIFCFFEGEDPKYYSLRIKEVLGDNIICLKPGDKRETLKVWRKIKKEKAYSSVRKMFFVDKDMDELPSDIDDDLYVTPCYSIENLYANKETFINILESEFSINKIEKDYNKAINCFERIYTDFCKEMLEFNALVLLRKIKGLNNGRVCINDIKTSDLVCVNLTKVEKSQKYDSKISELKQKLSVKESEVLEAMKKLESQGDYSTNFRGKNQLDFFVCFIRILKEEHSNGNFFEKKRTAVKINITQNRLSELSQYATTPKSLMDFLLSHKIA